MKIAEAREKQKAENRKTRMSELKRFSFCKEMVEWKCCWVSPPLRGGCGNRMILDDTAGNYSAVREIGRSREREEG
jgi:hypothetical protein